jgi:protein-S-isoprenylcysteine O-methyltransferase Ste14
MNSLLFYQATAALLGALFMFHGMDVRRKEGARDFVAPAWQLLMKLCAWLLIAGFAWLVASMREPGMIDWLGLALGTSGTAFVVAAKWALGDAHTFTGQHLERPRLVTHGVYAITRNPLYFGVFQCELCMLLVALHQLPFLGLEDSLYWFGLFASALIYAVSFNFWMARCEARCLELCFGDTYRHYRSRVPFLVPGFSPNSWGVQ